MDSQGNSLLVCDIGTGYLKCGRAGNELPSSVVASIVGRPLIKTAKSSFALRSTDTTTNNKEQAKMVYVGNEAKQSQEFLHLSHPIENGIVKNWNDASLLLKEVFQENGANYAFSLNNSATKAAHSTGRKVILTEAPMNPLKNREKLCQIMFEELKVDAVHFSTQAVLSLYARGMMSGVVVDVGDGVSHIIPVYEGTILSHLAKRLDIAGRDVTKHLSKLLFVHGYNVPAETEYSALQEMKERFCYLAMDVERERKLANETCVLTKTFKLSSGQKIALNAERFLAPEILFQPQILDKEAPGISESVFSVIQGADVDLRSEFYRSVVLSGGTTLIPGFSARLTGDLTRAYKERVLKGRSESSKVKIKVNSAPGREYSVYTGASVLADIMKDRDDFWLTREQWHELGPTACIERLADIKL